MSKDRLDTYLHGLYEMLLRFKMLKSQVQRQLNQIDEAIEYIEKETTDMTVQQKGKDNGTC